MPSMISLGDLAPPLCAGDGAVPGRPAEDGGGIWRGLRPHLLHDIAYSPLKRVSMIAE